MTSERAQLVRTGLRRAAWPLGLLFVALAVKWMADGGISAGVTEMRSGWQATDITGYQAAWTALSIAAVVAVYWWGVGSGSRYEPPPVKALKTADTSKPAPPS